MADGERARLMAVVAHPDDETFGCGSLLLHAAARGMTTAVGCATRGEAGEIAPGVVTSPGGLGALRERELAKAAEILNVSKLHLLGFHDSGMSGDAGAETLVGAELSVVRDEIVALLEDFRPTIVVTLDASDGHRDHTRIRDATLAAVEAATWRVERVYLHCLAQSLMRRWVEHMAATDPSWEHLRGDVPGTPDELITTIIDSTPHLDAREKAMRAHASQRSPYDGLPDDLRKAFLTTEQLRRVVPPWDGGAVESELATRS